MKPMELIQTEFGLIVRRGKIGGLIEILRNAAQGDLQRTVGVACPTNPDHLHINFSLELGESPVGLVALCITPLRREKETCDEKGTVCSCKLLQIPTASTNQATETKGETKQK